MFVTERFIQVGKSGPYHYRMTIIYCSLKKTSNYSNKNFTLADTEKRKIECIQFLMTIKFLFSVFVLVEIA